MRKFTALLIVSSALSACSLAPDFTLPETGAPAQYKTVDAEQKGHWQPAAPMEEADRGQWWKIFGDVTLNDLEQQAIAANFNLKAASARVEQARATLHANASTIFPTINIGGNAVRSQPANAGTVAFGGSPNAKLNPYTLYSASGVASYEVDLFGRVRDNESALNFEANAQDALYRSTLLALQADVADHYFALRALDAEMALLRGTVTIREEAQRIMQKRFNAGSVGEQDLSRTQGELASAQADLLATRRSRSVYEHALAVLLGKMPQEFSFAEAPLAMSPPLVPPGLPSSLLLRRPDVAAAQAAMESANKRIGVARTGFFPTLNLTASGGYESNDFADLFKWSSRTWALGQTAGSGVVMNLLDSGRTIARVDAAQAAYQEALNNYRTQVLVAFKDVEDGLTTQHLLAQQSEQQDIAAASAERTTTLTQKRYDLGDATYFEVVDAERNSLAANRATVQLRGARLQAAVQLIRALGGGWGDLPAVSNAPAPSIPEEFFPFLTDGAPKQSTAMP